MLEKYNGVPKEFTPEELEIAEKEDKDQNETIDLMESSKTEEEWLANKKKIAEKFGKDGLLPKWWNDMRERINQLHGKLQHEVWSKEKE
ncbi:MAG: hypothetical protein V1770_01890 [bacterium]